MFEPRRLLFWSNAKEPYCAFSNFSKVSRPIKVTYPLLPQVQDFARGKTFTFRTTEHAFQALRAANKETFELFLRGNLLSKWTVYKRWPAKSGPKDKTVDLHAKRKQYWRKKRMLGIIPKQFTKIHPERLLKAFGAELREIPRLSDDEMKLLWTCILTPKFKPNSVEGDLLADTEGLELVEFCKGPKPSLWGAKVVNNKLVGKNFMGKMLMKMRRRIVSRDTAADAIVVDG